MPDATIAGPISTAVDGLRTLVANLAFFQTWTTTADATTALKRVFVSEIGYPILSIAIAGGVMTIATREQHQIQAGDVVTIEGASVGAQSAADDTGAVTVVTTPSTNTLTITTLQADAAIFYPDHAMILPAARPIAVIDAAAEPLKSPSIGTGGAVTYSGALEILLEADVSAGYRNDRRNAGIEASNAVGQFLQALATTQGTGDLICLNEMDVVMGPEFTIRAEQDNTVSHFERWHALIRVTWGIQ